MASGMDWGEGGPEVATDNHSLNGLLDQGSRGIDSLEKSFEVLCERLSSVTREDSPRMMSADNIAPGSMEIKSPDTPGHSPVGFVIVEQTIRIRRLMAQMQTLTMELEL